MEILLKGKHWQVFLLLFGLPILGIALFMVFMIVYADTETLLSATILVAIALSTLLISAALFLWWLSYITTQLYNKLPSKHGVNFNLFKIGIVIVGLFIAVFALFLFNISGAFTGMGTSVEWHQIFTVAMPPFFMLATLTLLYCLYFTARALKTVELRRQVAPIEYMPEFFQLWYFPLGVWIIQPRINRIFAGR